jgi:peptide-methionine (R)-S-oxide reductase
LFLAKKEDFLKDVKMFEKLVDVTQNENLEGTYTCTKCGSALFAANARFAAGCGFTSFWKHLEGKVILHELDTYGRRRIQLLCSNCGQHLGHLFQNKHTPSKLRYCINEKAILLRT